MKVMESMAASGSRVLYCKPSRHKPVDIPGIRQTRNASSWINVDIPIVLRRGQRLLVVAVLCAWL